MSNGNPIARIISLEQIRHEAVGGKAEGLARLIQLGLRVPPGFVIQQARPGQLPPDLATAYAALGGVVAVRSSAIGEDSADASFAGQYETILDVEGEAALVQAIEQCLQSIHGARALAYQQDKSQTQDVEMAVVVQRMVPAVRAGVLFTVDPVNPQSGCIVIDAVSGVGEKLVSGEATPDHYVLDITGALQEQELIQAEPLLTPAQLAQLWREARDAEARIGHPLDMEWAFDASDTLWWLQARPITTLTAALDELDTPLLDPKHIYTRCNVSEALPGALCPLTHSVTGRGLEVGMQRLFIDFGILEQENANWYAMASFQGHLFMNLSTMAWTPMKTFGSNADDVALAICGRLIPELNEGFVKPPLHTRIPALWKYFSTLLSARRQRDQLGLLVATVRLPRQATAVDQWRMIDTQLDALFCAHHAHLVSSTGSGMMTPLLLGILAKGKPATDEHHAQVAALLAGAENVESADIALGATRIQQLLLQLPAVQARFVDVPTTDALAYLRSADAGEAGNAFAHYLVRHGHRSISEMDMRMKEWACDPEPLVRTLQVAVGGLLTRRQPARAPTTGETEADAVYAQQNVVIKWIVRLARKAVQGRELSKSRLVAVKRHFKQAYRDLADMMVAEHCLPDADALYFLTHQELGQCIREHSAVWGERAAARRRMLTVQQTLTFPDVFVGKPVPLQPDLSAVPADKIVRGRVVSRGCVTGRAKVARVVAEAAKLREGDILIAPITDVAWTPFFSLIGGLATDIGSAVSHGAVVAREYGLPAIVKTDVGTHTFVDGDVVVLDANNGVLRLATTEEAAAFLLREAE